MVNIFPSKGRNAEVEAFLNLKIGQFEFTNEKKNTLLVQTVRELDEVRRFGREIRSRDGLSFGDGMAFSLDETLSFTKLTMRESLNHLAKVNQCGWFIQMKTVTVPAKQIITRYIILGV